jgi:hypothetical protein
MEVLLLTRTLTLTPQQWDSNPTTTTAIFKVLHLVRDVRGVLLSRLKLEAFCGDTAPLLCARPLCQVVMVGIIVGAGCGNGVGCGGDGGGGCVAGASYKI